MNPIEEAHNLLNATVEKLAEALKNADDSQEEFLNALYQSVLNSYVKLNEYLID